MKILSGLSPMAGFTDMPFRIICSDLGADFTVSEMISAAAVCFHDKKTYELARLSPLEAPCALQIFGHDPAQMAYAAEFLITNAEGTRPCAIDINMGCPVRKIVTSGDGSALMKDPTLASEVARSVYNVTSKYNVPLWVKIRAGWDKDSINAPYVASMLADAGASRITVHGRTREQMYAPYSDNAVIRAVREVLPDHVTLIGNGDITSLEDAVRMVNETGCDGVAVGRAACGDPWIFRDLRAGEKTPVELCDRIELALHLTREVIALKGEFTGIRESRGRAAHFIKGIRGSAQVRDALNKCETYEEFERVLRTLLTE